MILDVEDLAFPRVTLEDGSVVRGPETHQQVQVSDDVMTDRKGNAVSGRHLFQYTVEPYDNLYAMMNFKTQADVFAVPRDIADQEWEEWIEGPGTTSLYLIPIKCVNSDHATVQRLGDTVKVHMCSADNMDMEELSFYQDYELFVRSRAGVVLFYTRPNILISSAMIRNQLSKQMSGFARLTRRRSSTYDLRKLFGEDAAQYPPEEDTSPNTDDDEENGSS